MVYPKHKETDTLDTAKLLEYIEPMIIVADRNTNQYDVFRSTCMGILQCKIKLGEFNVED